MSENSGTATDWCTGCNTQLDLKSGLTVPECACFYCPNCLENSFQRAVDGNAFPPQCCGPTPWSFESAKAFLSPELAHKIQKNLLELTTKNKLYCYKPSCSFFIAPYHIHNKHGYCQKCNAVTCAKCREKEHFGPCLSTFQHLKSQYQFQQCPKCGCMVERIDGCNHMYCACGTGFCYECGALEAVGCHCVYDHDEDEDEDDDASDDEEHGLAEADEVEDDDVQYLDEEDLGAEWIAEAVRRSTIDKAESEAVQYSDQNQKFGLR